MKKKMMTMFNSTSGILCLAIVGVLWGRGQQERAHNVEIVAHRGASRDAPENTVASFELGWRQAADACELDIRLTRDGQIVASHDATTKRTGGVDKPVAAQSLAELQAQDSGRWKGPQWAGQRMPTLAEALATIPAGKRMYIEIKAGPQILPELDRALRASKKRPDQIVLIAFQYETLRAAHARMPDYETLWICGYKADPKTKRLPEVKELVKKALAAGFQGLDLDARFPLSPPVVAEIKKAGLKLGVWTVNDAARAHELAAAGVDSITTDRPGWLREQLLAGEKRGDDNHQTIAQ